MNIRAGRISRFVYSRTADCLEAGGGDSDRRRTGEDSRQAIRTGETHRGAGRIDDSICCMPSFSPRIQTFVA